MPYSNRIAWHIITAVSCVMVSASFAHVAAQEQQGAVNERELREHFGEQQFAPQGGFILQQGQRLPGLIWEHPDLVATVVDDPKISTRWFNERFEEVHAAPEPGRYYAYGEAPAPAGPVLRRAMTCCCVGKNVDLKALAQEQVDVAGQPDQIEAVLRQWRASEDGAVELAALLFEPPRERSVRVGQWQMENATRHVRLKRKLMGLDDRPIAKATPRLLVGDPARVLRHGRLAEAGITAEQLKEIEGRIDAWYADSQEPMAIVIARNGVIVTAKGFGEVDGKPVTIDTPMLLHSAMKPLIGLQLATYVDRDILRLDEPMGNYLPEFDTPRDRHLTFRAGHVHATGIHFPWPLAFSRLFYFHTWHEALIAHCKREWEPGAKYRYGVVGVILSVRALELLRGRNYWDAMERDLFEPLGIRNVLPGGTGFSAENLARIGVLLDNRGKYGKWEVFSEETHAAILPTSLQPYFPKLNMKYGIGLQDQARQLGPGSYGHGGGCGTLLVVNPNKHVVFAMVRNGQGKNYQQQRSELMASLREWIK